MKTRHSVWELGRFFAPVGLAVFILAGGLAAPHGGGVFGHHETVTLLGAAGVGAEAPEYATCEDSRSLVQIEGTSTLHDWTVRGRLIEGKVRIPEGLLDNPGEATAGPVAIEGELSITSRTLRSFRRGRPYSARMDEIMYEKLLVDVHPEIHYKLKKIELKAPPGNAAGPVLFETTGRLTVAGAAKEVSMPVEIERIDATSARLAGKIDLKMSDFRIDPPVALAGTIRTGDAITVSVEWVVRKE